MVIVLHLSCRTRELLHPITLVSDVLIHYSKHDKSQDLKFACNQNKAMRSSCLALIYRPGGWQTTKSHHPIGSRSIFSSSIHVITHTWHGTKMTPPSLVRPLESFGLSVQTMTGVLLAVRLSEFVAILAIVSSE